MKSPLLVGEVAEDARQALGRISRALLKLPKGGIKDPSLADGLAGLALSHAALDDVFPDSAHGEHCQRALTRAIGSLARMAEVGSFDAHAPSLYCGFVGIAWVAEHLAGPSSDDVNEVVDQALLGYLQQDRPWRDPYDLMNGLVGIGVYALERIARPSARRIAELVVARLAETAYPKAPGVTWWSDPDWIPPELRDRDPLAYNLGLAHGVPGVIAFLGAACAHGIDRRKARMLLEDAIPWLLSTEIRSSTSSSKAGFPRGVGAGVRRSAARSAWCYGDPGVAAALLVAGHAVGNAEWQAHGLRIARRAAAHHPTRVTIRDACLCHGAAGLGHLLHRLYRMTGEERLARAARDSLVLALQMRLRSGGIAGFAAWGPSARGYRWLPSVGFLNGVAGIALALASALRTEDPSWDRVLLVSAKLP